MTQLMASWTRTETVTPTSKFTSTGLLAADTLTDVLTRCGQRQRCSLARIVRNRGCVASEWLHRFGVIVIVLRRHTLRR